MNTLVRKKVIIRGACMVMALALLILPNSFADSDTEKVIGVKAALIYHSSTFVTWPKDTFKKRNSSLIIGVWGSKSIQSTLKDATKNTTISDHPIKIIPITIEDDWSSLHIIYVDSSVAEDYFEMDITEYNKYPILTLSDDPRFAKQGGMIQIHIVNNKPKISVNNEAAKRKKITLNSQLLKLADIVHEDKT
jgi:hypothetical protein